MDIYFASIGIKGNYVVLYKPATNQHPTIDGKKLNIAKPCLS
jgi:hypothetical protein